MTSFILPATGRLALDRGSAVSSCCCVSSCRSPRCLARRARIGWSTASRPGLLLVGISDASARRRWDPPAVVRRERAAACFRAAGYCTLRAPSEGNASAPRAGARALGRRGRGRRHLILPWLTFAIFFAALYVRVLLVSPARDAQRAVRELRRGRRVPPRCACLPSARARNALAADPHDDRGWRSVRAVIWILIYIEIVFGLAGPRVRLLLVWR